MATEYQIVVNDTTGTRVAILTDMWDLAYTRRVNDVGAGKIVFDGTHALVSSLDADYQFEIRRRDRANGVAWYTDFAGFLRGWTRDSRDGIQRYTAMLVEQNHLLTRRIIAYKAGTTNRSDFSSVAAETVMKNIVQYNMTVSGTTADGRERDAAWGSGFTITVATDAGGGNTISYAGAWKTVLAALQDVARIGGGDFSLTKTAATTWEFDFHAGQLGTDRSATVVFSLGRGNMANPEYSIDLINEKTVAIVGGQGQGSAREIVTRTGSDYSAANDQETFVDARNHTTTSGLQAKGDEELDRLRKMESFRFDVLQTPASIYGKHYFLGDLVTARYEEISVTQKIVGVSVSFDGQQEQIAIEMETQ